MLNGTAEPGDVEKLADKLEENDEDDDTEILLLGTGVDMFNDMLVDEVVPEDDVNCKDLVVDMDSSDGADPENDNDELNNEVHNDTDPVEADMLLATAAESDNEAADCFDDTIADTAGITLGD